MAFDVITPKKLGVGEVAVSPSITVLSTVDVSSRDIVKNIDITNTNSVDVTANVYLVPSGGAPAVANSLLYGVTIPANGIVQWFGTQVLNAGDSVQASASVSGVTMHVSGGEAT